MPPPPPPSKTLWEQALDALDPTRTIKPFEHNQTELKREWTQAYDPPNGAAVWQKIYRKAKGGLDLRQFNEAEITMCRALKGLPNCYQLVTQTSTSSELHTPDSDGPANWFATTHMGPTVYDWCQWPVYIGQRRYRHVFQTPINFVRLALAGLRVLAEIHDLEIVHADLNPGNQCLAARIIVPAAPPTEDRLEVSIDWKALKLIDFGYSIQRKRTPTTLLPLSDGSPRLNALFERVDQAGRAAFTELETRLKEQHKTPVWPTYDDARYQRNFWDRHGDRALDELRGLDWREDYWRFGKLLSEIAEHLPREVVEDSPSSVRWAINGLPKELQDWGKEDQVERAAPDCPGRDYRRKLEQALRDLDTGAPDQPVRLLRRDLDPGYQAPSGDARRATRFKRLTRPLVAVGALATSASLIVALAHWHDPPPTPGGTPPPPEDTTPPTPGGNRGVSPPGERPLPSPPAPSSPQPGPGASSAPPPIAPTPQVASPTPPAPPPPTASELYAAWRAQTDSVERSAWWQRNEGAPDAQQSAWIAETQRLAELPEVAAEPLFYLGALACSGRAGDRLPRDSAECGRRYAAALTHPQMRATLRDEMAAAIVKIYKQRVSDRIAVGAADKDFAVALLPAEGAIVTLACVAEPRQPAAALDLLNTLLAGHTQSASAGRLRAAGWAAVLAASGDPCHPQTASALEASKDAMKK